MNKSLLIPLVLFTLVGVNTTDVFAQGGGFTAGELFVYNVFQSPGYNGYGIMRVDPVTGASSMFVQTTGVFQGQGEAIAFDPYRQRLVFSAPIGGIYNFNHLWFADGAGNLQNVTAAQFPQGIYPDSLAPSGDGRIYCHLAGINDPFYWFDAANQLRVLYDSDGVTPMKIDGDASYFINGMIHDAATNSLFVASTKPAPGFPDWAVNVRKLPLSADGARVIGPVGNVQFEISPNPWPWTSGEMPVGWSHGPNGKLVLCVNSVDYVVMSRMLLVDPVTSAISVWGNTGANVSPTEPGYGNTPAGTYCSALDQVVIIDNNQAWLRGYSQGSAGGTGNVIATSPVWMSGVLTNPGLISVPPSDCTGGWIAYGLGLEGSGNFVPKITGAGCPEPGAAITVSVSNAVGGGNGVLFIGPSKATVPFYGGTFHLGGAVLLAFNLALGGAPGAAGMGSLSLPAVLPAIPGLIGTSVFLQAAFGDAAAPKGVSLTQGLELAIG